MPNTSPLYKRCTSIFLHICWKSNNLRADPEVLFPACYARGIHEGMGCPRAKELCCQQLATAQT